MRSTLILLPRERIELPYLYLQNSALTTKQPRLKLYNKKIYLAFSIKYFLYILDIYFIIKNKN